MKIEVGKKGFVVVQGNLLECEVVKKFYKRGNLILHVKTNKERAEVIAKLFCTSPDEARKAYINRGIFKLNKMKKSIAKYIVDNLDVNDSKLMLSKLEMVSNGK